MTDFFHGLPIWANFLLFALGAFLIDRGASLLVHSSVAISEKTGIPKMLIGATIVSVATTFPEFTVSFMATLMGYEQMAVGNIIGSCACNIGIVLAVCLLILPIVVDRKPVLKKGFVMLAGGLGITAFAFLGGIPRWGGGVLLAGFVIYVWWTVRSARKDRAAREGYEHQTFHGFTDEISRFLAGMICIGMASTLLVQTGREVALWMGVPELIIALTMISLGTSLPELVTAIRSALMGHSELSLGNVIGANILNMLWAFGACALIRPLPFERQTLILDCPFLLILMAAVLVPVALCKRLERVHGVAILAIYAVYITLMMVYFAAV